MADPTYPLFPVFAFLGAVLPLIPLPWHLKAWNSGTCYYMIWASVACLNQFVNSVVWSGNVDNRAPIWCDISIRIMLASSVALPASSLCINRRLYNIATSQAVVVTTAEKRRAILIDTLICVLFPVVYVAVQYVVQGHRFNIYEGIGCYPALYNTLPMYFLSAMWPIVIGLISAVYCALSLRAFMRRRIEFSKFLSSSKALSVSRYFRLMALATTEICCTTPLAAFTIWLNATASPIGPWRSWADTHYDYGRVERYPALLWRQSPLLVAAFEFTRWVNPLCAIIFFLFFGFADEAKRNYRLAFWAIAGVFGFKPQPAQAPKLNIESVGRFRRPKASTVSSTASLPSYAPPTPTTATLRDVKREKSISSYSMHPLEGLASYDKEPPSPSFSDISTITDIDTCTTMSRTSESTYIPEIPRHDPHISVAFPPVDYPGPIVR